MSTAGSHKFNYSDFTFVPLDEYNGDLSSFSCSEMFLSDYLTLRSHAESDKLYAKSYLALIERKVVGYFTLKTDTADADAIMDVRPDVCSGFRYTRFPAIQIASFAVDESYVRQNVGRCMMTNIYGIVVRMSMKIGVRFVVVHSLKDAVGFYRNFSFEPLPKPDAEGNVMMFLDILSLIREYQRLSSKQ